MNASFIIELLMGIGEFPGRPRMFLDMNPRSVDCKVHKRMGDYLPFSSFYLDSVITLRPC